MTSIHQAVMTTELIDAIRPQAGGRYLDGTLGGGTHTEALLQDSAPDGVVCSLDVDPVALERARERFKGMEPRWIGVEANFRHLAEVTTDQGLTPLEGVVLDLGFSSDELEDFSKGISFQQDGPLDMRLGPKANEDGLTAADIVNSWTQQEIETVLRNFGEESHARTIAREILKARKAARIIGTLDLVSVIKKAVPHRPSKIHPATKTFQALRIVVNDELESLRMAIKGAQQVLKPGGRLAVITFHSLEDRIVKQAFQSETWSPVYKKPLEPTEIEIKQNPRARSAKLRAAERL
ncbi:16S rRNA (cytosine(1402)-N(4))-methyltransferase RsmH [Candidatus Uhrbacteria bacterium]|nr:16S rRNA (cytosine(1402)-N(4))-methyltransferase RsmH [Candidatus Uhrbacteria bacterium]MBD3284272.1 16S rRNA (cytosine(1402)-N(4))-methyltransferase RsmH [Candidatus Uhrbacteria bacterium]